MAKIPYTDNDFRRLTVFDVQEITTTIYSAELSSDYENQSIYYGVLDSIIQKSSLLTDSQIIPLISQFVSFGGRLGNVPQQYTSLINFITGGFEEEDEEEQDDGTDGDEFIDEEEIIDNEPFLGPYYYPLFNEREIRIVKQTGRLAPPISGNVLLFFEDLDSIKAYSKSISLQEPQIQVAECFMSERAINFIDYLTITDNAGNPIDIKFYISDIIWIPYIIVQNIIQVSLPNINRSFFRPRRAKIGTG
jgi:hypothetical protein